MRKTNKCWVMCSFMKKNAVTLMEVLVAIVLIVLVLGGLVNLFISSQRWLMNARARIQGGELGKRYLDPLEMQVRADQWNTSESCIAGNVSRCDITSWEDSAHIWYNVTYDISGLEQSVGHPLGLLRKAGVNLTWTEHDPLTP
jgi:hypothetical protein